MILIRNKIVTLHRQCSNIYKVEERVLVEACSAVEKDPSVLFSHWKDSFYGKRMNDEGCTKELSAVVRHFIVILNICSSMIIHGKVQTRNYYN